MPVRQGWGQRPGEAATGAGASCTQRRPPLPGAAGAPLQAGERPRPERAARAGVRTLSHPDLCRRAQEALAAAAATLAHYQATRPLGAGEAAQVAAAADALVVVLCPYAVACLGRVFPGAGARVDLRAATAPLAPEPRADVGSGVGPAAELSDGAGAQAPDQAPARAAGEPAGAAPVEAGAEAAAPAAGPAGTPGSAAADGLPDGGAGGGSAGLAAPST